MSNESRVMREPTAVNAGVQLATRAANSAMEQFGIGWDNREVGVFAAELGIRSLNNMPIEWHRGALMFYPGDELSRTAELYHALQIGAAAAKQFREGTYR